MLQEFVDWNQKIQVDLIEVSKLLAEPLSDAPEQLIRDLRDVEVWNGRVGSLLAQADSWLDRYSHFVMPSKENRTEMDRKALLESETSPIRVVRDTILHFQESIKTRITLGQSILRYEAQFIERSQKMMAGQHG